MSYIEPTPDHEIPAQLSEDTKRRRRAAAKRADGQFLRGPIPLWWLRRAARLPGKALTMAVALWFGRGVTRNVEIRVGSALLAKFGMSRYVGYRALRQLELARLVSVRRAAGRCARARILDTLQGDAEECGDNEP